jgi:hypothetical protein
MCLAAAIFDYGWAANIYLHVAGLISPGVRILGFLQLGDKLIERCVPTTDARTIAQYCVEGGRVAIVEQADLLITLNRTGAHCET